MIDSNLDAVEVIAAIDLIDPLLQTPELVVVLIDNQIDQSGRTKEREQLNGFETTNTSKNLGLDTKIDHVVEGPEIALDVEAVGLP